MIELMSSSIRYKNVSAFFIFFMNLFYQDLKQGIIHNPGTIDNATEIG